MTQHISVEKMIDHFNQILGAAEREQIDAHLDICPTCRAKTDSVAQEHRMIRQSLLHNLGQISPSPQADFAAIAPRLKGSGQSFSFPFPAIRQSLASGVFLVVLAVSVFTLIYSLRSSHLFSDRVIETRPLPVTNGDFEIESSGTPTGWRLSSQQWQEYLAQRDDTVYFDGQASALLTGTSSEAQAFGLLQQSLTSIESLRGQRIRLSAYIKTEDVDFAGLWLRVGGYSNQNLEFDNMQNRPIEGTNDWLPYEAVVDVSPKGASIDFGVLLGGNGRVWIDDVRLEVVGKEVPVTNTLPDYSHLDIEVGQSVSSDWFLAGARPQDYTVSQDTTTFASGSASALLASKVEEAPEFGTLMQTFEPGNYLGQRVRLSALIKTEDVDGWAGLWLRVDDAGNQILQFDNMQNRAITGTTDWARYEVVLDVPPESKRINLGLILAGNGRVWIDNVTLEIVDDNVPTTYCQICLEDGGQ